MAKQKQDILTEVIPIFKFNSVFDIEDVPFIKAVERLRVTYSKFSEDWIEKTKERLLDVEIVDIENEKFQFRVNKNPKLGDTYSQPYRKVQINKGFKHCSCFYGQFGYKRERSLCGHLGACDLMLYYLQEKKTDFKKMESLNPNVCHFYPNRKHLFSGAPTQDKNDIVISCKCGFNKRFPVVTKEKTEEIQLIEVN